MGMSYRLHRNKLGKMLSSIVREPGLFIGLLWGRDGGGQQAGQDAGQVLCGECGFVTRPVQCLGEKVTLRT